MELALHRMELLGAMAQLAVLPHGAQSVWAALAHEAAVRDSVVVSLLRAQLVRPVLAAKMEVVQGAPAVAQLKQAAAVMVAARVRQEAAEEEA